MDSEKQQLNFPPDVDDFIHRIIANAVMRAIRNGTFKHPDYTPNKSDEQSEKLDTE